MMRRNIWEKIAFFIIYYDIFKQTFDPFEREFISTFELGVFRRITFWFFDSSKLVYY